MGLSPYYQDDLVAIYHGKCEDILPSLQGISAVVTDPPYGLGFMSKEWDTFDKSQFGRAGSEGTNDLKVKKNFNILPRYQSEGLYQFALEWAKLLLDVCLPGAMLLSFGGTRTSHRIACAIEDAGWQIRDTIMWVHAQGFPKSLDISKAIDKQAGVIREVIGEYSGAVQNKASVGGGFNASPNADVSGKTKVKITIPSTPEAKIWEGYGTGLKPSYEPVLVCMNPIDETFANNALKHKVAGLNIDECRIETDWSDRPDSWKRSGHGKKPTTSMFGSGGTGITTNKGRFPSNFIHDGSQEVMELFPDSKAGGDIHNRPIRFMKGTRDWGKRTFEGFGDSGSAARFFYAAKASRSERDAGLNPLPLLGEEGLPEKQKAGEYCLAYDNGVKRLEKANLVRNNHPTVKPLSLMSYLCKLVKMPEYNLILDPFCGSGTTLIACKKLGIPCIGIDSNEEYCEIASKRCANALQR